MDGASLSPLHLTFLSVFHSSLEIILDGNGERTWPSLLPIIDGEEMNEWQG